MLNLAVIGVGGIGSRHLQALALLKQPANIQIVDVSDESISNAKNLFESSNPSAGLELKCFNEVSFLNNELDVAIIATSSMVRRKLVTELLATKKVKYLILEKVLFPAEEDYEAVTELIKQHGCKVWVNCPRRMNPVYREIKRQLLGESHIDIYISGSNWGMGCNSLHFIDLISFLTGGAEGLSINTDGLDTEILQSKRSGYIEFTGCLRGSSDKCEQFVIISDKQPDIPVAITIRTPHFIYTIKEFERRIILQMGEQRWVQNETEYKGLFQSQLTNRVVESLLENGDCELTPFDESVRLHLPLLQAFLSFYNKQTGEENKLCPIT